MNILIIFNTLVSLIVVAFLTAAIYKVVKERKDK